LKSERRPVGGSTQDASGEAAVPHCEKARRGKDWVQNENLDNLSKKGGFAPVQERFAPFLASKEGSSMVPSGSSPVEALNAALNRFGAGDHAASREFYAILFQSFWDSLIRFLRYRREATPDDARDTVSNLMLSLYVRALAGKLMHPPRRWQAYLRKAALRQYEMDIHKARRATPRARDVDLALALHDGPRPDLQASDRDEIRRMFERALPKLTLTERRVIAMRGQKWSYAEIAEALSIAEVSVGALASRARAKLKVEWFKLNAA